jgi:type II secretory pathway predicted ATPase ExeA
VYVNPKYGYYRQKMLKTLNRRQNCADDEDHHEECTRRASTPIAPALESLTVDELVRRIEGNSISLDPRKAAKKARQKEKKVKILYLKWCTS